MVELGLSVEEEEVTNHLCQPCPRFLLRINRQPSLPFPSYAWRLYPKTRNHGKGMGMMDDEIGSKDKLMFAVFFHAVADAQGS